MAQRSCLGSSPNFPCEGPHHYCRAFAAVPSIAATKINTAEGRRGLRTHFTIKVKLIYSHSRHKIKNHTMLVLLFC